MRQDRERDWKWDRQERRILIVTANEGRRIRVTRLLTRAGYHVHLTVSQREALHWLATGGTEYWPSPDAILVDQESLGPAAQVVIAAIHRAELGIPTVVLSSFGAADDVIACLRAGAADYISLPAEPEQILDVLERVLAAPLVT